ncbi:MAG: ParB/RepB/Spo0J family partition protein [Candidatus Dadabacteria bacterium]|nr:MAG: ParB/RepB/Spo0J family partition protein [Candidatus Dadabacteria bacterium]
MQRGNLPGTRISMAERSSRPRRQALGRGLSALIPQQPESSGADQGSGTGVQFVPIDRVDAGTYQARTHFDPRSLSELARSIERYGILQPLVVLTRGDRFELIAGERRLRAARQAGLTEVPVLVRDVSDDEQLELGLIENVQRADLNPIEEARGYLQLIDTFGLTQEQAASRIGKSRPFIANKIRLLGLPEEVQELIAAGSLSEGHARALLGIRDRAELIAAAREIVEQGLTVREAEQLSRDRSARPKTRKKSASLDPDWEDIRKRIETALGTPVELRKARKGGTLTIRFFDDETVADLLKRLGA